MLFLLFLISTCLTPHVVESFQRSDLQVAFSAFSTTNNNILNNSRTYQWLPEPSYWNCQVVHTLTEPYQPADPTGTKFEKCAYHVLLDNGPISHIDGAFLSFFTAFNTAPKYLLYLERNVYFHTRDWYERVEALIESYEDQNRECCVIGRLQPTQMAGHRFADFEHINGNTLYNTTCLRPILEKHWNQLAYNANEAKNHRPPFDTRISKMLTKLAKRPDLMCDDDRIHGSDFEFTKGFCQREDLIVSNMRHRKACPFYLGKPLS